MKYKMWSSLPDIDVWFNQSSFDCAQTATKGECYDEKAVYLFYLIFHLW